MPIRNVAKRATTIERWLSSKWHQGRLGGLAFPLGRRLKNRGNEWARRERQPRDPATGDGELVVPKKAPRENPREGRLPSGAGAQTHRQVNAACQRLNATRA